MVAAACLLSRPCPCFSDGCGSLVTVNPLEDESVALAQGKTQGLHDGQHLADNLFMQLRVRGVSHVLFLHGGVDEGRPVMVTAIAFLVDTDAFRQNQLHALLADTLAEMHKLALHGKEGVNSSIPQKYW